MILDVCCGSESMYHGSQAELNDDEFITMDIRRGDFSYKYESMLTETPVIVEPDILANMRYLPFKDDVFDIIVCDPPHMDCGLTGFWGKKYGSWNQQDTIDTMELANIEFSRCLRPHGTLVPKSTVDIIPRFKKMLSNFKFFLPIQTIRAQGCITPKESQKAALWYITINNKWS